MTSVVDPEQSAADPVTAVDPLAAASAITRPPRQPGLSGRLLGVTQGAATLPMVLLFLLSLVEEVDRVAFGVLAPEIKASFGLTDGQYLTLIGVASALVIFAALPIGYLADRRGRIRLAWLAGVLWPLFTIATAVAGVFGLVAVLVVARIAHGVGKLVNEPVHPSLIADLYAPSAVPAVSGVVRSAIVLAAVFGPVAGLLGAVVGWQLALTLLALPSIPLALRLRRLPEPTRAAADGAAPLALRASFAGLRQIATLRRFWLSAVLYGAGTVQLQTLPSLFFAEEYGVGPTTRGFLSLISSVAGLAGLVASAVLSRRAVEEGRPARLAIIAGGSTVVLGAGFALVGMLPFVGSLASLLLIGAGGLAVFPAFQALIAAVTPLHLRSQAFASVIVCVGIGAIVVAPATGVLADTYGYRAAFVVLGLIVGVGGLVQASSARSAGADLRRVGLVEAPEEDGGEHLVRMRRVDAGYDGVQVLFDVDLEVRQGEILALLGTNGAGKSTLLRVLSGLLTPSGGSVLFDGQDITGLDPVSRVKRGIVQMPGGKGVFPTLTVDEHLQLAGWLFADDKPRLAAAVEDVLTRFPRLRERRSQLAGNLSGGEQQQLALGMALVSRPKLLCIDELSLGLAPAVVETLLETVREINAAGTTIVVVEQSLNVALSLADRAYFLEKGSVRFSGPTAELLERDDIVRSVFLAGAQDAGAAADDAGAPDQELPLRVREGLDPSAPVLEVREVRKSFGGVQAVRGVTLSVAPGEILGLVGGNGAGKTTLFDLVSGFLVPDGGSVVFRGRDVTTWSPDRRALDGLGRSFQDARIFGSLTVAENIAVALERHLEVRDPLASTLALPAAQRVERDIAWTVDDLVALLGLEAYRDAFAGELSTGTRRVVDLAMSLAHDPDLLLLDEPSAGIAQRETEALGPLLRRVRAETGCALVVIEHDMPLLAGLCDRLVALELGAVLSEGTPEDVLADPAVVAGYLGGDPAAISRSGTVRGSS